MKKKVFIPGIWKACSLKSIAFNHYNYIPFSASIGSIFTYSEQTTMTKRLQGFINVPSAPSENCLLLKKFTCKISYDLDVNRRAGKDFVWEIRNVNY